MNPWCRHSQIVIVIIFLVYFLAELSRFVSLSQGWQCFQGKEKLLKTRPLHAGFPPTPQELPNSLLEADYSSTKLWMHLSSKGSCHAASNYCKLAIQFPQNLLGSAHPSVTAVAVSSRKKVALEKSNLMEHQENRRPAVTVQWHDIHLLRPGRREDRSWLK